MGSCDNLQLLSCTERVPVASSCTVSQHPHLGRGPACRAEITVCVNVSAPAMAPSATCRVLFVNCTLPLKWGEVFFQNETYSKPWGVLTGFSLFKELRVPGGFLSSSCQVPGRPLHPILSSHFPLQPSPVWVFPPPGVSSCYPLSFLCPLSAHLLGPRCQDHRPAHSHL